MIASDILAEDIEFDMVLWNGETTRDDESSLSGRDVCLKMVNKGEIFRLYLSARFLLCTYLGVSQWTGLFIPTSTQSLNKALLYAQLELVLCVLPDCTYPWTKRQTLVETGINTHTESRSPNRKAAAACISSLAALYWTPPTLCLHPHTSGRLFRDTCWHFGCMKQGNEAEPSRPQLRLSDAPSTSSG